MEVRFDRGKTVVHSWLVVHVKGCVVVRGYLRSVLRLTHGLNLIGHHKIDAVIENSISRQLIPDKDTILLNEVLTLLKENRLDASNLFDVKDAFSVLHILDVVLTFTFLAFLGGELRVLISKIELGLGLRWVEVDAIHFRIILIRRLNLLAKIMEHSL